MRLLILPTQMLSTCRTVRFLIYTGWKYKNVQYNNGQGLMRHQHNKLCSLVFVNIIHVFLFEMLMTVNLLIVSIKMKAVLIG